MTRGDTLSERGLTMLSPTQVNGRGDPAPVPPAAAGVAVRGSECPAPDPDGAANWDRLLRARVGRLSFGLSSPGLLLD